MGSKASKSTATRGQSNESQAVSASSNEAKNSSPPNDAKQDPKSHASAVSYNSKRCINIHTFLATSPGASSHHLPSPPTIPHTVADLAVSFAISAPTKSSTSSTTPTTIYELRKRRPGCTGMFWRSDPRPNAQTRLTSNDNWPRDGAQLKGQVVQLAKTGERWLLVHEVKQQSRSSSGHWVKAPSGAFMPFEYNNHYYLAEV